MSRMGEAALWVRENGLEKDPNALTKYLEWKYIKSKEVENDTHRERDNVKQRKHSSDSAGSRSSES